MKNIFVICDRYDNYTYDCSSFTNLIVYISNVFREKNLTCVVTEPIYDLYAKQIKGLCDSAIVLKTDSNIDYTCTDYCHSLHEALMNKDIDYIFTPSSITGRCICAYLSGKFNAGATADVVSVENVDDDVVYKRTTTFNNKISTIKCLSKPQISSLKIQKVSENKKTDTDDMDVIYSFLRKIEDSKIIRRETADVDDFDLSNVVIGIGRGIEKNEVEKIKVFAVKFKIPIVCSRAAVEDGLFPYSKQVGQSGKSIASSLYIAIGISGAIQHLVGVMNCKKIIAINPDKSAAIHKIADISIYLKIDEIIKSFSLKR